MKKRSAVVREAHAKNTANTNGQPIELVPVAAETVTRQRLDAEAVADEITRSIESARRLLREDAIWIDEALADEIRAHLQDIELACRRMGGAA